MTEGISKERLLFWNDLDTKDLTSHELLEILLRECAELEPWLPIDENTPKDKRILLFANKYKIVGNWDVDSQQWLSFPGGIVISPTHYKLLPDDQK